ncbi:hypothetical protein DQ384_14225 [Sphaerisporangium album]|uniref:Uncharacterized protein n=1 Tax=Sphaerisporangium album TaxID=509200 RepID=A0A367FJA0_9ACTN|nr:class II aldolase/adducin family protein [Sphaerisporangium album]RCG30473.1 hypothetical protein DQ384_14225 [Sphaerisporangium album]
MPAGLGRLRRTVALACRILANAGLAPDILGHVSVRTTADAILVRCRGPREVSSDDVAELPDLGTAFNDLQIWRHQLARLRLAGLGLREIEG